MEGLWPIITIVGPLLLVAIVIWAGLRNRATRHQDAEADAGARRVYAEDDRRSDS